MDNNNETLHENCTFVCITEDVNNQTLEVTTFNSNTTTLDEAKEWIGKNCARGHYSCNNFDKIIVRHPCITKFYIYIDRG